VITVGSSRLVGAASALISAGGGRLNIFAGIYPKDESSPLTRTWSIVWRVCIGPVLLNSTQTDMLHALSFIENGQVNTLDIISHVLPLEELGQGLELVKNRQGLKVVVEAEWGLKHARFITVVSWLSMLAPSSLKAVAF